MTQIEFATYIRNRTQTDSNTFTDARILSSANAVKDDIAVEISKVDEDIFGSWFYRNLEADKREYGLPQKLLKHIKYLEIKILEQGTKWKKFTETDLTLNQSNTDEDSIRSYFQGRYEFDIYRKSLWLLCGEEIIDVVDGIKLWAMTFPEDLTSLSGNYDMSIPPSDTTHGMPREIHKLWADLVVIEYKLEKDKKLPLTRREQLLTDPLYVRDYIATRLNLGNLDREVIPSQPVDVGYDY